MLSILDKYIIRKFLSTFFFMLGIIMLLAMVFDVSEKLSEFISNHAPVGAIIFEYYLSFLLFHGNMFSSMIIFIPLFGLPPNWRKTRNSSLCGFPESLLAGLFGLI